MKNILSYIGFNQEISPRLSRLDSLSIVSRQSDLLTYVGRIVTMLLLLLTIGVGQLWGYTGTFTKYTTSTLIDGYYVIGASESSSNSSYCAGTTVSSGRITGTTLDTSDPANNIVWIIENTASGWTFNSYGSSTKYIKQTSTTSGKGMEINTAIGYFTLVGYNSSSPKGFKFSSADQNSTNQLKWNNSNKWFSNYANAYDAGMAPVTLYRDNSKYRAKTTQPGTGSFTASATSATWDGTKKHLSWMASGATVTLTATPPSGYAVNAWTVTKAGGGTVTTTTTGTNTATFSMPADQVTVTVTWKSASSTCTLHHGSGGSTTTNMTQGSGTLPSGNAVAGWTFSHWSTSQQTTPSASTPGTRYNSGVTTPAQANLYAFYINDCNSLYCTAPTAVYHIVNMGPAVSGGDDDDYFYTTVGGNNSVFCNITSGTTVYLTGHIGTGHSFHEWHVTKTDDASTTVTVTNPTAYDGTAYFTMPAYNVDIEAEFCQTPTQPTVTVVPSLTSATVNWTTSTGASLYRVMILNEARDVNVTGTQDVNAPTTTKNMTGLQPLTNYYAAVRSQNPCGGYVDKLSAMFTTLGYTVTYNQSGEDVTTSVPTDANQYGASGSVTLLDKNSESHKADYYFAGWTDNSSGTGTVYKPGDTYTITGNVTFYAKWVACSAATTPSSLSVSGSGTPNVTFSWDAVDGATKYQLVLMDESSEYYEFETTSTSKTINISEVGDEGEYMGQVRACNGTIGYCYEDFTDDIEFAAGCPSYSFHFGTRSSSDWNDPSDYCFVASTDGDGNSGVYYYLSDFTLPAKPHYYVGWQGSWNTSSAKSADADFSGLCFGLLRANSCATNTLGTYSAGNNQGAIGTLRVRSSYTDNNKYIDFIPGGYVLSLSENNGSTYSTTSLTAASSSLTETVWTTEMTTVSSNLASSGKFFVDLATSSGHVWSPNISQVTATSSMGYKTNSGDNWGTGLSSGMRGKFRIWADNCNKNWNCHFVPYHRIIFHANYPVGVSPADTYSVDVSVEETNSSIALASAPSAPTGYSFDGWYDAATGGTKKTGSQTISAGASADVELYAHWTLNTHSVTYSAPTNGNYTISVAGGSATSATKDADYGQTVTLAATGNTGYEFTSWTVTGETSGDEITVSNNQFTMPDEDVTVVATFTAINYNVTYSAPTNGNYTIKVASGTASSATKTANYGQTITLAATPSEGYQLSSWTIRNTSTSADVTGSVSLSSSTTSPATFTMPAYGVTVIATFEARNYTLTWDWNGGETSSTTHTAAGSVTYGTTIVYPANNTMSKTGYSFTGWSSTPATMPASNTTITAQWSVNSYNVAVASVEHVTITATPASESVIAEGANRDVNYGKSVTLAYTSLESKNYWGGWKVTNAGGDDVTESVVAGNTLTVPAYDVTVSAVTYGNLVAWCDPQVTVSDGFCLTSYYIDAAASTTNSVYTTSAADNLLTINSTDLGGVDRIEFIYLDGSDNPVALTSSPFRMCNDGSSNYNVADPGTSATSWTKSSLSNTCALSYSIRYKPTGYNLMDNYKLKMVFKKGASDVRKTIIREMNGRSLPEEFVIAAKYNGQWYALPNTLKGTQAEQGAITPIKITVDIPAGTPTQASYAPSTAIYKGRSKYAAANPSSMALTSTGSNYLQTSTSVNKMWLSSSGDADDVDWYFKSTDRSVYELTMDPVNSPTKKMGIDGGNMGYYGTPTVSAIYLLPVEHKYTDIPATATEWGQYSVVLAANPGATATKAQARVEDGEPTSDQTITAINAAMGTAKNVKVPVGSINLADLTNNEGKLLYIDWFAGSTPLGTSCVTIPRIIAASRDMYKTGETTKGPWNTEVHVLPGATLTANPPVAAAPAGWGNNVTIKELHVYPGATINIANGTLNATTLRLRNGWTRAGEKQYNTARVYIADDAALTKTTASMDYDIYEQSDGKHYYPLAVPFETAVSSIDYADTYLAGFSNYGASGQYVIKEYDGENRAKVGEDRENNWDVVSSESNLVPGKGYIMTAVAVKGEAIIRVPLVYNDAWTSDGEKGTANYDAADHTKNVIAVTAHSGAAATAHNRHKGWNMLGVPFMSCYGNVDDIYSGVGAATLINGELVVNTSADQNMQYQSTTIPYVSVPSHDFAEYIQTDISEAELLPGWSFLVQVNESGNLTFAVANQQDNGSGQAYAPKRATKAEEVVRTGIILSDETNSDKTTFLISSQYSSEYEIGADLEKMFGNGYTLAVYSLSNSTRLAYNAMSPTDAQQLIPLGYRAPADGEYTFSLNPRYANAAMERVDLIDNEMGTITDLLSDSYTFSTARTQNDTRFVLNIVPLKKTPTDVDNVQNDNVQGTKVYKVIIQDKMYIIRGNEMYDATGKRVSIINR